MSELPKVGFYPGSSIGNFQPAKAVAFLANVAATLGSGSHLLVGVDRKKATATLEAAYNDEAGITAEFNRNLLTHIAGILGVDIDPGRFTHRAIYNPQEGCIQMFLDVSEPCSIRLGKQQITFAAGESIHTENSYKYSLEEIDALAAEVKRDLAVPSFQLGMAALAAGNFAEAEKHFGAFVSIIESLAVDYPENAVYQRDLWVGLDRLGQSLALPTCVTNDSPASMAARRQSWLASE
ncbi:MAG: L-histidine N(alpha)-methyltransferase [Proteobacteria bacterium]|nr:L-histidine N(alpha)-methyltransferase [Pseudomonadota bacterium]